MKYTLSEETIQFIKGEAIPQRELAEIIDILYQEKKIDRSIPQQSISRYLNGSKFSKKDTEKIILMAVQRCLGTRKYHARKRLYSRIDRTIAKEPIRTVKRTSKKKNIAFREVISNESLASYLMSDEELTNLEEQNNRLEIDQVKHFWYAAPKEIQLYWMYAIEVFVELSNYCRDVFEAMVGIESNTLMGIADSFYSLYCRGELYNKLAYQMSDSDLQTQGRIMNLAGLVNGLNLTSLVSENSLIYKCITNSAMEVVDQFDLQDEEMRNITDDMWIRFCNYFEECRLSSLECINYLSWMVCMQKEDWLLLNLALLLDKTDYGNQYTEVVVTESKDKTRNLTAKQELLELLKTESNRILLEEYVR